MRKRKWRHFIFEKKVSLSTRTVLKVLISLLKVFFIRSCLHSTRFRLKRSIENDGRKNRSHDIIRFYGMREDSKKKRRKKLCVLKRKCRRTKTIQNRCVENKPWRLQTNVDEAECECCGYQSTNSFYGVGGGREMAICLNINPETWIFRQCSDEKT